MNVKNFLLSSSLTVATLLGTTPVFADSGNVTSSPEVSQSEDDVIITPYGITQDTYIYANQAAGGQGSAEFEHYGNFKYDGRGFIENQGDRSFTYKTYTASGKLVHSGTLAPGKNVTLYFTQTVLGYDLMDGKGKVTIASADGGTAIAYFRYNVLDNN